MVREGRNKSLETPKFRLLSGTFFAPPEVRNPRGHGCGTHADSQYNRPAHKLPIADSFQSSVRWCGIFPSRTFRAGSESPRSPPAHRQFTAALATYILATYI